MAGPAPSNREKVRIIEQVDGAVPGSGSMTSLALATWDANTSTQRNASANISPNGKVVDNPAVSKTGTGSASCDWTTWGYHLIEEGLGGAFRTAYLHSGSGITAAATGNKLVLPSGTWTAGLAAGDFLLVKGFADGVDKNGSLFLVRVLSAPSGVNLPIDPVFKSLVDETAAGTLKVWHDGDQIWDRQVDTTYAAEHFSSVSGVGNLDHDIMFTSLTRDFGLDAMVKAQIAFRLSLRESIDTPLSLATGTPTHAPGPVWSSGPNFGAALMPAWGLGLRYGGALFNDIGKAGLSLKLDNGAKGSRTIDHVEDQGGFRDGAATASVELTVLRNGNVNAETILADAQNVNAVVSLGWGFWDGANITYFYMPELQPSQETANALADQGEGKFKVTLMARDGAIDGYLRTVKFTPR